MSYYLYSVNLPFSNKEILYREITSKEQIMLCKADGTLPANTSFAKDYTRIFFELISNCVKDPLLLEDINLIDYIILISKIRIASLGNELELNQFF